jgi:hypothetical protein
VAKIQMEVIPEPEPGTAAVLVLQSPQYIMKDPFAVIRGESDTDYVCGCCRATIASHVERGMLVNIVLKCIACGSYNIIRGT